MNTPSTRLVAQVKKYALDRLEEVLVLKSVREEIDPTASQEEIEEAIKHLRAQAENELFSDLEVGQTPEDPYLWVKVKEKYSVSIKADVEGIIVDIYDAGASTEPAATAYAFYYELDNLEEDDDCDGEGCGDTDELPTSDLRL